MITALLKFIKINQLVIAVVGIMFALLAFSRFELSEARKDVAEIQANLDIANGKIEAQNGVIEAFQNVIREDASIQREVRYVTRQIENLPTAATLVPHDIALAWHAGIVSLRHDEDSVRVPHDT